jgi:putative oxidoreductase
MHRLFPRFVKGPGALGLFVLRAVAGSAFMLHGLSKLHSEEGLFHWMDKLPNPAPAPFQALAALTEVGGGVALILGLFTPIAALGIAATMVVALASFHLPQHHPFVGPPGQPSFEPAAGYLAVMIVLILVGPGALSFDFLLFGKKETVAEDEQGRAARWLQ